VYDGLYVRNTFLDCDSPHAPKLPVLERGRTAPATVTLPEAREGRALEASGSRARRGRRRHHHAAAVAPELRQVGDEPCSLEDKTHPEHDDLLAANGDAGRPSLSPVPPSPVELVRMRTFDPFEDSASEMPGRDGQAEGVGIPRVKTFDPLEEQWLMDQGGPWAYHPGNFEVPPYMMMPAMPAAPGEWLPADGPHLVPCHDRLGGGFAQPAFEALAQAAPAAQAVSGLTGSACPLTSSLDTLTAPPRPTAVFQGPEGFGSSGGSPPSAPAAAAVAAAAAEPGARLQRERQWRLPGELDCGCPEAQRQRARRGVPPIRALLPHADDVQDDDSAQGKLRQEGWRLFPEVWRPRHCAGEVRGPDKRVLRRRPDLPHRSRQELGGREAEAAPESGEAQFHQKPRLCAAG